MNRDLTVRRPRRRQTTIGLAMVAAALGSALGPGGAVAQDLSIVTFGSATIRGTYYAVARAICSAANAGDRRDLRCSPEPTAGSAYNLFAMQRGELDFALVQSDWQRSAAEGTGPFAEAGPIEDLRGVMALFPESVTLVARKDSGISGIGDIAGKVVDIGDRVTGRRATNDRLLAALALSEDERARFRELSGSAVATEFCRGTLDAVMLVIGHPNPAMASSLRDCNGEIVPIAGPAVDALLAENSDYSRTVIAAGTYPELTTDVATFSVTATLVTRAEIRPDVVEYVTRTVLDNLPTLQASLPVLRQLAPEKKQTAGMTVPLHPAAAAVFAERGMADGQ